MAYELIMQATSYEDEQELTMGTPQSDTWSFATTLLELLTLRLPYHSLQMDVHVLTAIISRKLPFLPPCPGTSPKRTPLERSTSNSPTLEPSYFAEVYKWPGVWELCKSCWHFDPQRRPTMGTVVQRLGEIRKKGPYDHVLRPPPHSNDLYGPKRLLSPQKDEENGSRKSPRIAVRELPETIRHTSVLRTPSSSSYDGSDARFRSPRTPTMRAAPLITPEEVVRKPRSSRLSISSSSASTPSLSSSSSGYASPRVHPYSSFHSSAFKSNRPGHRRSPSSSSQSPASAIVSTSAPASLGPSRVASTLNYSSGHSEAAAAGSSASLGSLRYPTSSQNMSSINAFPEQRLGPRVYSHPHLPSEIWRIHYYPISTWALLQHQSWADFVPRSIPILWQAVYFTC